MRLGRYARAFTPHSAPAASRIVLGRTQLAPQSQSGSGGDARKSFSNELRVHEVPRLNEYIRQLATVIIAGGAIAFKANPPVENERLQPFARFHGKRRRPLEPTAHLRRIDPQQPHAADAGGINRVSIEHSRDERHRAAPSIRWSRLRSQQCRDRQQHGNSGAHPPLQCNARTRIRSLRFAAFLIPTVLMRAILL
jgi:hypothetical protein